MMSSRQVDIHPEAVAEARAAAQWYRVRSPSAAHAFSLSLIVLLKRLRKILEFGPGMLGVRNASS